MKRRIETKIEKIDYMLKELEHLKRLEFCYTDEIAACNYAMLLLRRHKKKLELQNKTN